MCLCASVCGIILYRQYHLSFSSYFIIKNNNNNAWFINILIVLKDIKKGCLLYRKKAGAHVYNLYFVVTLYLCILQKVQTKYSMVKTKLHKFYIYANIYYISYYINKYRIGIPYILYIPYISINILNIIILQTFDLTIKEKPNLNLPINSLE